MGTTFNFTDIFKSGFTREAVTNLSALDVVMTLAITLAIGLFIFWVYRKTYSGILYTRSFNVSLVVLALVTALVIMVISANIVLSLGMVGALSIVRFRTAIKDPMDIVFMFWAIAGGILSGAGFYAIAVVGSLLIGLVLALFSRIRLVESPYLLIVNAKPDVSEAAILEAVRRSARRYSVKSKTVSAGALELTLEFRLRDEDSKVVNEVSAIAGVGSAVLVSYNGDYVS